MNQRKNLYLSAVLIIMLLFPIHIKVEGSGKNLVNRINLMPVPENIEFKAGRFKIADSFSVLTEQLPENRISKAVSRMLRRLSNRTGLIFAEYRFSTTKNPVKPRMILTYKRPGKLVINEDESYHLHIQSKGITLSAETDIGILRGIETVLQLVEADHSGYYLPCLVIKDKPRFTWRGLLIDSCRHFMPIEVIKRNLDGMCSVKMNVFHWHLTEDQGFRVECKTFPGLHEHGSDGRYYTQRQIREIIEYASDRGIRIIPEFDIPGHSTSWLVGYPELASLPGPYKIERGFGIFDPCFNPVKEETYHFFDRFFEEMTSLFRDEYIHIGGDEVNGKQWDNNPEIQKFMMENHLPDSHALQAFFNRRIMKLIFKHGKKMAGWEQILQPDLPKSTIIQSYLGEESLIEAARMGYQIVNSKADEMYIDLLYPTDFHYLYDPLPPDIPLKEKERKLVLGSEATMWGELISPETIDSRIWPRTAAIAERLWSPSDINDVNDMYRRLDIISFQLEEHGLTHIKNQKMMLRHLTRGQSTAALKHLVDVIEPIILYDRPQWQKRYTQQLPQTRVVDAAVPDARVAREFRNEIDLFLKNKNQTIKRCIQNKLETWKNNHLKLKPIIKQSPILREIEALSEGLSLIADIGLQALKLINSGKTVDNIWIRDNIQILEKVKKPIGDCKLKIVSAIEKLLYSLYK